MIDPDERFEDEDIVAFWHDVLRREERDAFLMLRAELLRDPVPFEVHETIWYLRERALLGPFGDGSNPDGSFNVNPEL